MCLLSFSLIVFSSHLFSFHSTKWSRREKTTSHLNVARALKFHSILPLNFLGGYIKIAAYLINHSPTPLLQGKTPYEVLFNKPLDDSNLHVFGLCFVHSKISDKFAPRTKKCIFLGYRYGKRGGKFFT